jgi:hypothetical protein
VSQQVRACVGVKQTDFATIRELRAWGEQVCPSLKGAMVLGTYSGLRPATEHRDYQIKKRGNGWITVAGIRSTGLTASSAIAEYVADLHEDDPGCQAVENNSEASLVRVTAAAVAPLPLQHRPVRALDADGEVQVLPTLPELAGQYRRCVCALFVSTLPNQVFRNSLHDDENTCSTRDRRLMGQARGREGCTVPGRVRTRKSEPFSSRGYLISSACAQPVLTIKSSVSITQNI